MDYDKNSPVVGIEIPEDLLDICTGAVEVSENSYDSSDLNDSGDLKDSDNLSDSSDLKDSDDNNEFDPFVNPKAALIYTILMILIYGLYLLPIFLFGMPGAVADIALIFIGCVYMGVTGRCNFDQ